MNETSSSLSPGTIEADKQLIAILLAQFNACRNEIQMRSNAQTILVNLNISAIGVIAGFYFAYDADPRLLFVIPLLSPMLGIVWIDHAINIGSIGRFIENSLLPRLEIILRQNLPDYEKEIRAFEKRLLQRFLLLVAPMALIFAVLPAGALILAYNVVPVRDLLFWMLVGTSGILILIFGGYALYILFSWVWPHAPPSAGAVGKRGE